jgi:hypothetical protein
MAVSATMRRAVRRIAEALTRFAKLQGWGDGDYQIYYVMDPKWGHIHVLFVANGFEKKKEYENYVLVREYLEKELGDMPGLLNHLGLVVRSSEQVDEGGIYAIGPPYREYRQLTRS